MWRAMGYSSYVHGARRKKACKKDDIVKKDRRVFSKLLGGWRTI